MYAAWLARCPRVPLTDTETATFANRITFPFASAILTPEAFPKLLGPRHSRYNGIHELAYLHPSVFTPKRSVVDKYGLSESEPFSIVRFISWEAGHDLGVTRPHQAMRRRLLDALA